ncbi:hypothetical protein [Pseudomonas lini]
MGNHAALLAKPGAHHKALLKRAHALHQDQVIDSDDLCDMLELAESGLAFAVESLLDIERTNRGDQMHVLVTPMRLRGIALDAKARRRYPHIRGNVMVNAAISQVLGRATNIARVEVGMPLDPDPLPPLLDARLAAMAVTGFVLSGIEYIDGCAYAKAW